MVHNSHFKNNAKDVEGLCGEEDLLVRFDGEAGGKWCSLIEHNRGSAFALGFEKEEVGWMIEHLTKAIEMKNFMGFNRKLREKTRVHLMEVFFNNHGRFIRLSEFASNKKSTFLVTPEGKNGRRWENLKIALSSMLVVPSLSIVEKGRQCKEEGTFHKHEGPLCRSFANVVKEEGQRRGGLIPVGRWARTMVCECHVGSVNWAEVGRPLAKRLGHKCVVTIVPFSGGKRLFFVETIEEALSGSRVGLQSC